MRDVLVEIIGNILSGLESADSETMKNEMEDLLQAISSVIGQLKVETYPPNTRLCTEGAEEDKFYIIAKGEVAVYKQIGEASEKQLLAHKSAGEFFGEMALVLNAPRSADVVTTQESIMLELDRRAFKKSTRISSRLADLMSQRTINQLDANWQKEQEVRGKRKIAYQLFTSYSRQDEKFVRDLADNLQKSLADNNVTIWMDKTHIRPGDRWDQAVEDALDKCEAMLLILSENSTQSENVRDEWSYYIDEQKHIIPVLMEKCKRPPRLRRYQYIDFSDQIYADALAQLHARILELADGEQPVPSDEEE